MNDLTLLGPWVRRFLLEHLVAERNLARNTQRSYRDALTLLIPFVADKLHQSVDRLTVIDVSADLVRLFLADLEQSRNCSIATRNQRLAAIHALARFVGEHSPEHIAWCGQIRSIPFKKASKTVDSLPGEAGDGRAVRRPGPSNRPGPPRPCTAAVSLQLRSSRSGSRTVAYQRIRSGRLLREDSRQRWQRAAMSAVAEHR